jgi:hypothetical protein
MNFIQWLKMDYARTKWTWFTWRELNEKTPTDRGFMMFYAAIIPLTIWFAPFTYLIERYMVKKLMKEFEIKEEA